MGLRPFFAPATVPPAGDTPGGPGAPAPAAGKEAHGGGSPSAPGSGPSTRREWSESYGGIGPHATPRAHRPLRPRYPRPGRHLGRKTPGPLTARRSPRPSSLPDGRVGGILDDYVVGPLRSRDFNPAVQMVSAGLVKVTGDLCASIALIDTTPFTGII